MNNKITASNFFSLWNEIAEAQKPLLQDNWRKNKEFTNLIFHAENFFLNKIAQKMGLLCYSENYYSIDAIFYKEEDRVPNLPENSFWFRNIQIAFEHENNFNSGLYQEVSHLLILNCKLRVLISYPNNDEREDEELKRLHAIIKGVPFATEISENESFLLIFGYESDFEWKGLVYKNDEWLQIH